MLSAANLLNTFKPSVPQKGHWQTVKTQIGINGLVFQGLIHSSRQGTRFLLQLVSKKVFTKMLIYKLLQKFSWKVKKKKNQV